MDQEFIARQEKKAELLAQLEVKKQAYEEALEAVAQQQVKAEAAAKEYQEAVKQVDEAFSDVPQDLRDKWAWEEKQAQAEDNREQAIASLYESLNQVGNGLSNLTNKLGVALEKLGASIQDIEEHPDDQAGSGPGSGKTSSGKEDDPAGH